MRMPFGKWKNIELDDVPEDYLRWLRDDSDIELRPKLERAVDEAIENRGRIGQLSGQLEDLETENRQLQWKIDRLESEREQVVSFGDRQATDTLEKVHRRMAMRHHPDRGGDSEKMKMVNEVFDEIRTLARN